MPTTNKIKCLCFLHFSSVLILCPQTTRLMVSIIQLAEFWSIWRTRRSELRWCIHSILQHWVVVSLSHFKCKKKKTWPIHNPSYPPLTYTPPNNSSTLPTHLHLHPLPRRLHCLLPVAVQLLVGWSGFPFQAFHLKWSQIYLGLAWKC